MFGDYTTKRKYKIFLLDDDAFIREIYTIKFTNEGHEITSCGDPIEALELLQKDVQYDVILVDLIMPNMHGFEFLEVYRGKKMQQQAAMIILSNQNLPEDLDVARKFEADNYLVKANTIPKEVVSEVMRTVEFKKGLTDGVTKFYKDE